MEIKEVLALLGYTGDDKIDDLKEHLTNTIINKKEVFKDSEIVSQIIGKRIGDINTKIAKLFEYSNNELKDKSVEDVLDEIKVKYEDTITTMKEQGKEGKDKQVLDLQALVDDKDKSMNAFKTANTDLQTELDRVNDDMVSFKKNTTMTSLFSEIKRKVPEKDGITQVEQSGFSTIFNSKYNLDLDGETLVIKKKDGSFIKGDQPGSFATPEEIYKKELLENKLMKVNNLKPGATIIIPNGQQTEKKGMFREAL